MTEPTLEQVLKSYERSLVAKVQLNEFLSWGDSITASFKRTIAEHHETEQSYVQATVERRRQAGSG